MEVFYRRQIEYRVLPPAGTGAEGVYACCSPGSSKVKIFREVRNPHNRPPWLVMLIVVQDEIHAVETIIAAPPNIFAAFLVIYSISTIAHR